jgi:hypothetical protein
MTIEIPARQPERRDSPIAGVRRVTPSALGHVRRCIDKSLPLLAVPYKRQIKASSRPIKDSIRFLLIPEINESLPAFRPAHQNPRLDDPVRRRVYDCRVHRRRSQNRTV